MDVSPAVPQPILDALDRGWTVLTSNQRAARTLRRSFDLHQRTLGLTSWEPPAILAWDAWLHSLWYRLLLDGHASDLLLNGSQQHTLWRAIIAADGSTSSLRPVDALAQTAADAWSLLHAYRTRDRLGAFPGNTDTRTFQRWSTQFERRCAQAHYLTEAQLPEVLRAAFAAGHIPAPVGLLLIGFDSKTPAQTALLDSIHASGCPADDLPHPLPAPSLTLASAADEAAELAACARWLRALLTEQPHARAAVIVPSIDTARAEIDRVFRHLLASELDSIAAPSGSGPYEFSLGIPLAHAPMVTTALDILRFAISPLPLDRVCALLLSPHFAADTSEHLARAEFDAFVLRDQPLLRPEITLNALLALVADPRRRTHLPILHHHLQALRPHSNTRELTTRRRTFAEWAATIHDLLEAAGWAPLHQLDSIEFQTRRKWESALDDLTQLDFEAARVTFSEALSALERIATETLFAPESRHAPIQIMGPLESAGSSFDAVWFLHCDDLTWPATSAPNPLLPFSLQRELAMPGADPARDTAHALRITQRIASSAPTVVFSYAQHSADGPQRPSPILSSLALQSRSVGDLVPSEPTTEPIQLLPFADDTPTPPPPSHVLQGGAAILQSQAACGFRAFAEKRLFSTGLESSSLGLDPRQRGSLVHTVLQLFWQQVVTQSALRAMTTADREAQLNRAIDAAFTADHARPEPGWPRAYLDAERQRLLHLLLPWLDYEATKRSPFTVAATEQTLHDVQIGPLHLNVRVDRVDHALIGDEPAGEIILDYKTGEANPSDWLGPRPDAPQLPLYAVVSPSPHLAAVAFARVRRGENMGLLGYEAQDGILPTPAKLPAENLAAQVREWKSVLTSLAQDFHDGNAAVAPKSYPQTCKHCHQRLLCRLDPTTLTALEDPDSDLSPFDSEADSDSDFANSEADLG